MSKIVVNRKQYMTCRLCLEEQGAYTIVPNVKDQIEYCFGIEIQPFDGMPQLICEICENILCSYAQLKKKYIENQCLLKTNILAQQFDTNDSQVTAPSKSPAENPTAKNEENQSKSKRKSRIISSSSSDEASNTSHLTRKKRRRTTSKESAKSYNSSPKGYTKHYVCRICNTRWSNVHLVNNHVNNKHGRLYKKYGHIMRKHCHVAIPKTDLGNPDHGFADKIMFSKDKILKSVRGAYFITYTSRNYRDDTSSRPDSGLASRVQRKQKQPFNDSTDDEDICTFKRRKSVASASSTDTINLETKTEITFDKEVGTKFDTFPPPTELAECILLDDSSDNESLKSETQQSKPVTGAETKTALKPNANTINEILNSCRTKYIKKHILDSFSLKSAKNPSEVAAQLKRKVLSVGRKIINRKIGINCTPLARFLENKNLDIVWIPRDFSKVQDANSDANYIRILTRTFQPGEKENVDNETGWSDYMTTPPPSVIRGSSTEPAPAGHIMVNGVNGQVNSIQVLSASMPEVLNILSDSNLGGGKLLNANPVANPKQLPRKMVANDVTLNVSGVPSQEGSEDTCMPIIMSTTSLAISQIDTREVPSKPDIPKPAEAPRIKVKPFSELMSAATLQRMKAPAQTPVVITSQTSNLAMQGSKVAIPAGSFVFVPRVTAGALPPATLTPATLTPASSQQQGWESMVLNTVELPNKRTSSPFLYFKNLLQIHNLMLLDTQTELNSEFQCLIKFKVMYKQDNQNQPVVLCIALHCARNVFCFKIKDRNQQDINMSKITATWQWEVLKIFKGEVVPKVLLTAQKISTDQYEYTNKFLCLLKSIDLVR